MLMLFSDVGGWVVLRKEEDEREIAGF